MPIKRLLLSVFFVHVMCSGEENKDEYDTPLPSATVCVSSPSRQLFTPTLSCLGDKEGAHIHGSVGSRGLSCQY